MVWSFGFKIVIAMMAFAANSVLCRVALKGEHIDPVTFSDLRLISGAVVLLPLLLWREGKKQGVWSMKSGFFLMAYALCFSLAYIHLDTGTGALLLFGVVQLAMVAHGLFHGERLSFSRATGLGLAVAGMVALLLPGAKAPPLGSAVLMALSGLAWAAYTLCGKRSPDAVQSTAANFIVAVPFALVLSPIISQGAHFDSIGILLALFSGAGASAGAYVLWYSLLPRLESFAASTVQLSVPCLAMLGGITFLGESLSLRMAFSTLAVLAGILLVIKAPGQKTRYWH